jgi:hypothetical protein
MDTRIEVVSTLGTSTSRIAELLRYDPAKMLTGTPSEDRGSFVGTLTVGLPDGISLSHDVDVSFGELTSDGWGARFGLAWRARGHDHLFPVFGGDLDVDPDGEGSRLRLHGYYALPLGALGAVGDGLVGHHVARLALQGFLDAAAARLAAADDQPPLRALRSELYIG